MGLELTNLPDEVIILIFSQPILELNTLAQLVCLSRRIRHLALHVLNQYRLPAFHISLTIDQEGKNRIISTFRADDIDPTNLSITFSSIVKRPRRYYSNRALPIVRNMIMKDNYSSCVNSTTIISPSLYDFSSDDNSSCSSKEYAAQKESLLSPCNTNKENGDAKNDNGHIINHKILKKKEGFHILQVLQNPASWKLCYQITQRQGHEYYILPTTIKIQLGQLLLLENREKQQLKKRWPMSIMKWVTPRNKTSLTF